jgi:nucleoid-associated protein YgaU
MVKKAATNKQKQEAVKETKKNTSFFDYLRFGESYTSLILGIIVVIIATALLLSFVHNKNAGNVNAPITEQTQNTVQVSQQANDLAKKAPSNTVDNIATVTPTISPTSLPLVPTKPLMPTKPQITVAPTVTAQPTQPVKKIAMAFLPHKKVRVMMSMKHNNMKMKKNNHVMNHNTMKNNNIWIVQKNESLWAIAEQKYGSGYNWTDIAKANNLADPSDIHVGDRLVLPSVTPKVSTIAMSKPTVNTNDEQFSSTKQTMPTMQSNQTNKISGTTYTVVHGDNLWSIAVRAYGNGYRYVDIEKANNLTNPGMIFSGNVLSIPR